MGAACSSMSIDVSEQGNWSTVEEVRAALLPRAQGYMAEMQPGALVKLEGNGGFFNPAPLLNPAWFEGRMTGDEWVALIESLNECTARSFLGHPKAIQSKETRVKISTRVSRRETHIVGEDPYERAMTHLRATMPAITTWWKQHRGINIALHIPPLGENVEALHHMHHAPATLFLAILPQTPAPAPSLSPALPLEGQGQGGLPLLGSSGTGGGGGGGSVAATTATYQLNPPPNYFGNSEGYSGGISGDTYEGQPHMTTMPDTTSQFN